MIRSPRVPACLRSALVALAVAVLLSTVVPLSAGRAAAQVPPGAAPTAVVARGVDEGVYVRSSDPADPMGWIGLGGRLVEPPVAVSMPDGRIAVFGVGLDRAAWWRLSSAPGDIRAWTPWESLGGYVSSLVALVRHPPYAPEAHLVALGADARLWSRAFVPSTGLWGAWTLAGLDQYGGRITASYRAGAGFIDVVTYLSEGVAPGHWEVRALNDSGQYLGLRQPLAGPLPSHLPPRVRSELDGVVFGHHVGIANLSDNSLGTWTTGEPYFSSEGGIIFGLPQWGPDSSVLARGADAALWQWDALAGWRSLGGGTPNEPVAAQTSESSYLLGIRGLDTAVWIRSHDASGWSPWQSLGGLVTHPPALVERP